MSTPGSVRSGEQSPYTPPATTAGGDGGREAPRKRARLFRWRGIIPIAFLFALLAGVWLVFGERIVRSTVSEAATKALGAELDIADLKIHSLSATVELRGVALADPFDRTKNLFEIARMQVELEPEPLFEKKLVVKRLSIADVRITNSVGGS